VEANGTSACCTVDERCAYVDGWTSSRLAPDELVPA
jgi:hypothetical protein